MPQFNDLSYIPANAQIFFILEVEISCPTVKSKKNIDAKIIMMIDFDDDDDDDDKT